jgi:tetratricopeptide (TPR) repeat protein
VELMFPPSQFRNAWRPGPSMIRLSIIAACLTLTVESQHADDYSRLLSSAAEDVSNQKYDTAIREYQLALKLRPGAPEALNNLAVAYYQVHRYPEAYDAVAGIWESHRELKSAALIAGLAAVQCNRPKDAIAPLEFLLGSEPTNRDALLGLASAQFALGNYPEAVRIYRRDTHKSARDSMAWYGLAVCLERMAEDSSRKLSSMAGGSAYSKRLLGEYLQSTGDRKLAEEAFGEARNQEGKTSPEVTAQYRTARELADQSREAFETFASLAPESWQASVFFGDVARQHGDLVSALAQYQKAADAHPDSPAPDLGLGTVYWEMGDFDRARSHLRETLRRNPQAMQAVFELANIAVRRHEDADAIPLLDQFLKAQPDALAAHADLGRAYLHLTQYANAATELQKAAVADEQGDVHYQLSIALRKLGRTREADAALQESTRIRQKRLLRDQRLHETP